MKNKNKTFALKNEDAFNAVQTRRCKFDVRRYRNIMTSDLMED